MAGGTANILSSPVEYLKGVGPHKAELLKKELSIFTFKDLLEHFPHRHLDRTTITLIKDINPTLDFIQVAGTLVSVELFGENRMKRLVAQLKDASGILELVWFQGITWIQKLLVPGQRYLAFGRAGFFQGQPQLSHPEIETVSTSSTDHKNYLEPVYPSTEKLKARGLGGRQIAKLTQALLTILQERDLPENLPMNVIDMLNLAPRYRAYSHIHFPPDNTRHAEALKRLKFEELFLSQLRMGLIKAQRRRQSKGVVFAQVGELFNSFYADHLPFKLTGAQKRVIREIRNDTATGRHMNRLLQGDVGSGKTIVALLCMLLAADNGFQSCLMAPTEILTRQHYQNICALTVHLPLEVRIITGSIKSAQRRKILSEIKEGTVRFLVGTHAIIEDTVEFQNLGFAVIDEQHRFGVAQRAKLWTKAATPPHVLVMTATPIPRTLAMTAYGDLDYSVIDELPPNRKPILTVHRYDSARSQVMDFIRSEISIGRQAYIIFPLIEESEKMDYENLIQGYENLKAWFPEPNYYISMVHGRQTAEVRETNMQRFRQNDTQLMVATTVIEVGVDIPNASVMVIESAEKFGLSQLHQLRGRVGRGAEKSFCILLTAARLGKEAQERLKTMVATNDGFKIAEKDLELRGPGDIEGTRQSGILNLKLADLIHDRTLLETARHIALQVIEEDPNLQLPKNRPVKEWLRSLEGKTPWSRIS